MGGKSGSEPCLGVRKLVELQKGFIRRGSYSCGKIIAGEGPRVKGGARKKRKSSYQKKYVEGEGRGEMRIREGGGRKVGGRYSTHEGGRG